MVAYSFEKRHHDNILSGDKPFILRQAGKMRHARVGETVQLRDGPVFATGLCVFRATVMFDARSLKRALYLIHAPEGERLATLFYAAEDAAPQAARHREKVAVMDGFGSWADMAAWHAQQGQKAEEGEMMRREVIGFAYVVAKV